MKEYWLFDGEIHGTFEEAWDSAEMLNKLYGGSYTLKRKYEQSDVEHVVEFSEVQRLRNYFSWLFENINNPDIKIMGLTLDQIMKLQHYYEAHSGKKINE